MAIYFPIRKFQVTKIPVCFTNIESMERRHAGARLRTFGRARDELGASAFDFVGRRAKFDFASNRMSRYRRIGLILNRVRQSSYPPRLTKFPSHTTLNTACEFLAYGIFSDFDLSLGSFHIMSEDASAINWLCFVKLRINLKRRFQYKISKTGIATVIIDASPARRKREKCHTLIYFKVSWRNYP